MATTTARVLSCLELLQSRAVVTGGELAARLEVDPRTVRRYIAALVDLGIPVTAARGVGGGYRLSPGHRLPPLMLDDGETAAVVLGLQTAQRLGLGAAVERAQAKLLRVLPAALRAQAEALGSAVEFTGAPAAAPVDGDVMLALADAAHRRRCVHVRYTTTAGETSDRELSPFGVVVHAGRSYVVAWDHGRDALRTLRVDRVEDVCLGGTAVAAPLDLDLAATVHTALATVPWLWPVEATLSLSLADARRRIAPSLAQLDRVDDDHTALRMRAESLDWAATVLAGFGCAFELHAPDELRPALRAVAERLTAA